jgi:dTDP-4-dehydrorhamnose 3,5-epimerase
MKLKQLDFKNLYIFKPKIYNDDRGYFNRDYCKKIFKQTGINFSIKQGNLSQNFYKGTLRGFHYKSKPSNEYRLITCVTGSIFNAVIDLRIRSKTYKKIFTIILKSLNKETLIVPPMCASAFLTLENNTIVHYYMGDYFKTNQYRGLNYNDPELNISWPIKPKFISSKDKKNPFLSKIKL